MADPSAAPSTLSSASAAPDWGREEPQRWWDPGRRLLRTIRNYQRWKGRPTLLGLLLSKYYALQHRFWTIVSGAEIHLNCRIGGGLLLPHPNGIVIHPNATIGVNCILFQQVTLGTRDGSDVPVLGNDVLVGAGAKILGRVVVGDHARIGANAVVLIDVPPGAHAAGVPAHIFRTNPTPGPGLGREMIA
jgi:serine O-acetyltransferase